MSLKCKLNVCATFLVFLVICLKNVNSMVASKRNIVPETNVEDYTDTDNSLQTNFDDYPMVVPKRAALLLDRLMVALHHALEDGHNGNSRISDVYNRGRTTAADRFLLDDVSELSPNELLKMIKNEDSVWEIRESKPEILESGNDAPLMAKSFQRRAPNDDGVGRVNSRGRVYWRCYFNAVTCF